MTCSPFTGVHTALITPFDSQGNLDTEGYIFHLNRQKKAGVDGLVILGTTAEAATLTEQEKETLGKLSRKHSDLPLMVGCSASSTAQTIENIHKAAAWGADSVLICAPFYVKPTQQGLLRHYEEISKATPLPVLAYNNPSRTSVNIDVETLKRIADLPNVCGVKESSENVSQIVDILYSIKRERPDFAVICGDDIMTHAMMALGGDGLISGGANLIPDEMVALVRAFKRNALEEARELNLALVPLFKALRLESNPIALKAALQRLGLPSGNPRLPLTPLSSKHQATLETWLSVTQIS